MYKQDQMNVVLNNVKSKMKCLKDKVNISYVNKLNI